MPVQVRLLHYWWPLAMGASFTVVVHRATGRPWNTTGFSLLLCGIAAAYSLDRLEDARRLHDHWLGRLLLVAGVVSSLCGFALMWRLPLATALLVPLLAAVALLYPALKRVPLLKTLVVSVAWTWAAIALPFNDGSMIGWRWTLLPISVPLVLLIAAGCLLCDLKDEDRDRQNQVTSLTTLLGAERSAAAAVAIAVLGAVAAALIGRPGLVVAGAGLALVGSRPWLLRRDAIGPLIVDAILTLPGVLILARAL